MSISFPNKEISERKKINTAKNKKSEFFECSFFFTLNTLLVTEYYNLAHVKQDSNNYHINSRQTGQNCFKLIWITSYPEWSVFGVRMVQLRLL